MAFVSEFYGSVNSMIGYNQLGGDLIFARLLSKVRCVSRTLLPSDCRKLCISFFLVGFAHVRMALVLIGSTLIPF